MSYIYTPYIIDLPMVLNEAYFGKSDIMREMEVCIGGIRKRYKSARDMDSDRTVVQFNRLMEKQFGMHVFSLHIDHQNIKNAYTFPIATRFDISFSDGLKNKVEKNNKTGFRFRDGNNFAIYCCVYAGLLTDKSVTDGEILAIILHEVGHNFADAINKDIRLYNSNWVKAYHNYLVGTVYYAACVALYVAYMFAANGAVVVGVGVGLGVMVNVIAAKTQKEKSNTNKNTEKEAKSHERKNPIRGIGDAISSKLKDINQFAKELCRRMSFGGFNKILAMLYKNADIQQAGGKQESKQNEMVADKFATINGYGIELHSALDKIINERTAAEKTVSKIPIIGTMMNSSYNDMIEVFSRFDEHPKASQRIRTSIEALEYELKKKDCDPKLKSVLQQQVKELKEMEEKAVKKYLEMTKDPKFDKMKFEEFMKSKNKYAIDKKTEEKIDKEIDEFIKF